jgi:hypothetical protein
MRGDPSILPPAPAAHGNGIMTGKFFGAASSELAKSRYAPMEEMTDTAPLTLGSNTSAILLSDPKLLGFTAAKHKFVGKMFDGYGKVLEVGCMDGYGSLIVGSFVTALTAVDFYKPHIEQAKLHIAPHCRNVEFVGHDMLDGPIGGDFDGCFALDVLEHVDPDQERLFLHNVCESLRSRGVFIVGIPSLESQAYASAPNRAAHINCKTGADLKKLMEQYFDSVFPFSMNDEVLHTGYSKMSHYIINLCVGPKNRL